MCDPRPLPLSLILESELSSEICFNETCTSMKITSSLNLSLAAPRVMNGLGSHGSVLCIEHPQSTGASGILACRWAIWCHIDPQTFTRLSLWARWGVSMPADHSSMRQIETSGVIKVKPTAVEKRGRRQGGQADQF